MSDSETGTAIGASIGSLIPGLGTAAGAAIGGVIGAIASLFGGEPETYRFTVLDQDFPDKFDPRGPTYPVMAWLLWEEWTARGRPDDWAPTAVGTAQTGPYFPVAADGWPEHDYRWYRHRGYKDPSAKVVNAVARRMMELAGASDVQVQVSGGQTLEQGDPGQTATKYRVTDLNAYEGGLRLRDEVRRYGIEPPSETLDEVGGVTKQKGSGSLLFWGVVGFLAWRMLR